MEVICEYGLQLQVNRMHQLLCPKIHNYQLDYYFFRKRGTRSCAREKTATGYLEQRIKNVRRIFLKFDRKAAQQTDTIIESIEAVEPAMESESQDMTRK